MTKQRILVLCTGNSARSQIAEGLIRSRMSDRFEVFSAGSKPSGQVHPGAIATMEEIGIDISGHTSKSLEQFKGQQFDYVITVCDNAAEACPVFPGKGIRLHHDFTDPSKAPTEQQEALFRSVRDEMIVWLDQQLN